MLLTEQLRKAAEEEQLIHDTGQYYSPSAAHGWTTRVSKTITLSSQKIVFIQFTGLCRLKMVGNVRVLEDGTPILATGLIPDADTDIVRKVFRIKNAGTYKYDFQTSCVQNYSVYVKNIIIGVCNFPDKTFTNPNASATVDCGTTVNVLDQNITTPSPRKIVAGTIKQVSIAITLTSRSDSLVNYMKSRGEADESDSINWRLFVDDTEVDWKERCYKSESEDHCATYGKYVFVGKSNTTYNIKVKAKNTHKTIAVTAHVNASIIMCPWIIQTGEYEPITLDFPMGSTLYIVAEPLDEDTTKRIRLGGRRIKSFQDYYKTVEGTGILVFNHTFENVAVEGSKLTVEGVGGCIAMIGVDVR